MNYYLQQCIGTRLRRLSRIADSYYRKQLSGIGITEGQMTLLFVLSVTGEIEQGQIGVRLCLDRSTVSRNVRLLEKKEYIKRTDQYRPKIELTRKGKDLIHTLLPLWENTMDELTKKIGDAGMKCIDELEKKLS